MCMYIASYPVCNESPPFLNAQFFNTCKFNSTERKRQRMRGNWWLDPLLDRESNLWSSQGMLMIYQFDYWNPSDMESLFKNEYLCAVTFHQEYFCTMSDLWDNLLKNFRGNKGFSKSFMKWEVLYFK